jgi:integrase
MSPQRPVRRLRPARAPAPPLADAVDAFLAQPDLATSSRRSYTQTLGRLQQALGAERPLDRLSARELERAALEAWGQAAPATWNRHVATLRSFSAFCRRRGWQTAALTDGLQRRREPADRTKAIPYPQLDRLWRRDDVAVREKALWRLLYESAARAQEVLSLNVEDLDLENKRARVRSKGGDIEWLPPSVRLGEAAPQTDRRPTARPAVPRRQATCAGPDARRCRRVPGHRPRPTVLPTGRGALSRRVGWMDATSAALLGDHAPRRGRRRARAADGPRAATPRCAHCSDTPGPAPRRSPS